MPSPGRAALAASRTRAEESLGAESCSLSRPACGHKTQGLSRQFGITQTYPEVFRITRNVAVGGTGRGEELSRTIDGGSS